MFFEHSGTKKRELNNQTKLMTNNYNYDQTTKLAMYMEKHQPLDLRGMRADTLIYVTPNTHPYIMKAHNLSSMCLTPGFVTRIYIVKTANYRPT